MEDILEKKIGFEGDKTNLNKKRKILKFIKRHKLIIASTTLFWTFSVVNVVLICNFVKIITEI